MRTGLSILIALVCLVSRALTQATGTLSLAAIGTEPQWRIVGRTAAMTDIKGKRALKISDGPGMGVVWLDGYDFVDGVIELDILGRSQPVQGSFVGVAFHVLDGQTHEAVYFRPFNFRVADSTRHSHAVQYVSQPSWPWQRLRSEHPGQYEAAVVPEPDGDQWFHVRLVIERPKVSVFVNDARTPVLVVNELSDRARGSIGVWVGDGSGGHFANLRVTRKP